MCIVHSCTHWPRPRSPPPTAFGLKYEGRYWSAKIDDISLWSPASKPFLLLILIQFFYHFLQVSLLLSLLLKFLSPFVISMFPPFPLSFFPYYFMIVLSSSMVFFLRLLLKFSSFINFLQVSLFVLYFFPWCWNSFLLLLSLSFFSYYFMIFLSFSMVFFPVFLHLPLRRPCTPRSF